MLLAAATAAVAYVSEAFVGAIEPMTEEIDISELFVGIIIVPAAGKIAEHIVGADRLQERRGLLDGHHFGLLDPGRPAGHPDPGFPRPPPGPPPRPRLHHPGARGFLRARRSS